MRDAWYHTRTPEHPNTRTPEHRYLTALGSFDKVAARLELLRVSETMNVRIIDVGSRPGQFVASPKFEMGDENSLNELRHALASPPPEAAGWSHHLRWIDCEGCVMLCHMFLKIRS